MIDAKSRGHRNQLMRTQMLKRLLTAKNEEQKAVINSITSCIKYMHQNYDIEPFRLNRTFQCIIKEFKGGRLEPTHVPEDVFIKIAGNNLRIPSLTSTRLYEKIKSCILDQ